MALNITRKAFWILFFVLALAPCALAQRLPEGALHTQRERQIDIRHYKAEIAFDFEKRGVRGVAIIRFAPLRTLRTIALDAIELDVKAVTTADDDRAKLEFRTEGKTLHITWPKDCAALEERGVVIEYDCHPKAGMYFRPNPDAPGRYFVSTYGENGLHANWLPIYSDVNDKFSNELLVTVPTPYVAISNGKQVAAPAEHGENSTYHWLQERPQANYLLALYVGDFEYATLDSAPSTTPVGCWVPKGRVGDGTGVFKNTARMVEFFSRRFDYPYPWGKYDQVAVLDFAVGAMEHTGVTGHGLSILRGRDAPDDFSPTLGAYTDFWTAESIIAHELAHHWFGNNVTCRSLPHIWLNESFASFAQMLWDEEASGRDQYQFDVDWARQRYFDYVRREHTIRPLVYHRFDDANTIYNLEHTYQKGAAVLHMLRRRLGDEVFFRGLGHYLRKHEFDNADTHDLQSALEETSGQNLDEFFLQWVTGAGHPRLEVSYRHSPRHKCIFLSVEQVQPHVAGQAIFTLPATVTIATESGTRQERITLREREHELVIACDEKPRMVSFDGEGNLLVELDFPKEVEELAYQATHDDVAGRLWAIRELARRFPAHDQSKDALSEIISTAEFWALRAEAALQLGRMRTQAAEQLLVAVADSGDYRVRKAAALALAEFRTTASRRALAHLIEDDSHTDVVATAIVALARSNPQLVPSMVQKQFDRPSWYDEIKLACLTAAKELRKEELLPLVKGCTADAHTQELRTAALEAWEAIAPDDPELHRTLVSLVRTPAYELQQSVIEMLGRQRVVEAAAPLGEIVAEDADSNLVSAAREALKKIGNIVAKHAMPAG